jgi:acetyltransferase-like isoleucine patch superfamily enzyme
MLIELGEEAVAAARALGILVPQGRFDTNRIGTVAGPCSLLAGFSLLNLASIEPFTYSWSKIGGFISTLGRYCSIGENVTFGAVEHEPGWLTTSSFTYDEGFIWKDFADRENVQHQVLPMPLSRKRTVITIGHDVWIGDRAYIRNGVSIGHGAVIGTNTVVTRDVPPYAVVAGNPGVIRKYRFDEATIARLLVFEWWNYKFTDLAFDVTRVDSALDWLQTNIEAGRLEPYFPTPIRLFELPGVRIIAD